MNQISTGFGLKVLSSRFWNCLILGATQWSAQCAILVGVVMNPSAFAGTNSLFVRWSAFVGYPTVNSVLDKLGPTVFEGETSEGHLLVLWQNNILFVFVNGMPFMDEVSYSPSTIRIFDPMWALSTQLHLDFSTTKRSCKNSECDDPATQCSTNPGAPQAYCKWYAAFSTVDDYPEANPN